MIFRPTPLNALAALFLACCVWLAAAAAAWAQPAVPARPAELAQAGAELTLRGHSRFRVWGFEVYDASLWTTSDFAPLAADAQVLALELRYLRDFQAVDIARRSIKEMQRIDTITEAQEKRWLAEMQRVFPDVRKGDRLLGLQRPGQAAVFWHNGQLRGEIRDAQFTRLFFGIWLSSRTSEPALRQALLGAAP